MTAPVVNAADSGGAAVETPLYLANLDANVTDSQLYDLFSQIGDVVSVRVFRNWSSGLSLGYGYVNYANPQCAQRALMKLNFTPVNGKPIKITCSHKEPSISNSDVENIYIRNLEKEIDNKALHEMFSSFGHILSCKVARDASGQSMGYGFVQFSDQESARKAIVELDGMLLKGKKVYIRPYISKQERESIDKETFTNVFIKNFCESTTEEDLKNIFDEFGLITSAQVMRTNDGTSKCFGFVNFANSEDAARAVESLNGKIFEKKKWYVGRAQKKSERQHQMECVKEAFDKGSNLFVKNLDDSIGDKKLKELFSPFGSVTSCGVMQDEKGISTGRGMVAFSSPEEASRALSEMNGKILAGKPIYVALAQRKDDRIAQLQNLDKKIDHKALHGMLSSSCKVSTDAPYVHFDGVESAQKAITKLNSIVGMLNGVIGELNVIIRELNDMPLNGKEVNAGLFLNKQKNKVLVYKANLTNVFVENFCDTTTEDDLKNIFGEFGPITSTVVIRNEDGTSKCCGIVSFENAEDAARAVESLKSQKFDKKSSYVGSAKKEPERELELKEKVNQGSNLHVKNPNGSNGRGRLSEVFAPFRSATLYKVMCNQKGISRGRGLVALSPPEGASRAVVHSTTVGPLMPNMFVPLFPQRHLGSHLGDKPTIAAPMLKGLQQAPAISRQITPRGGGGYCYPHGGMFPLQYEIGGSPLPDVVTFKPIPVGPLASSACPLGRGRSMVKFCTRLFYNWSLRQQLR